MELNHDIGNITYIKEAQPTLCDLVQFMSASLGRITCLAASAATFSSEWDQQ